MDDSLTVAIKMTLGIITRENYTWQNLFDIGIWREKDDWSQNNNDWKYMQREALKLLHNRLSKISGE